MNLIQYTASMEIYNLNISNYQDNNHLYNFYNLKYYCNHDKVLYITSKHFLQGNIHICRIYSLMMNIDNKDLNKYHIDFMRLNNMQECIHHKHYFMYKICMDFDIISIIEILNQDSIHLRKIYNLYHYNNHHRVIYNYYNFNLSRNSHSDRLSIH